MPHFYLDLHECGDVTIDEAGVDVANAAIARGLAIESARDVMAGEVRQGRLCLGCAIVIRDDYGSTVMAVPFAEALSVTFAANC